MKTIPTAHEVRSYEDADPNKVVADIEDTLTDLGVWISASQTWERTQRAEWDGQSEDGRKWSKNHPEKGKVVFPFEGAADTRQRLVDMSIDELVMLKNLAFFQGTLRATAREANDADAAGRVQTLLNYEIKHRLQAELWEECNYATTWSETFGHAVLGVFWKECWTTGQESLTIEDLAVMVQEMLAQEQGVTTELGVEPVLPPIQDAFAVVEGFLMQDGAPDGLVALIQQRFPTLPLKRVKKVIDKLRKEGADSFRVPVKRPGRPTVQAYMPGFDVFYPWMVGNITEAPWVAVQELYWEPDLRAMAMTQGWNEDFIDAVIQAGPGLVIDQSALEAQRPGLAMSIAQSMTRTAGNRFQAQRERSQMQYAVLRVYLRAVDEDGIPAMHEIVMNPKVSRGTDGKPGLVGLNRLVDYYHEGGCFVSIRREFKIRSLWESRGIPEIGMTNQEEMKARRDSHIDRTSLASMPPVRVGVRKIGAGGGERLEGLGIKPGGMVPSAAGMPPTEFMQLPAYSGMADGIEKLIATDNANLLGLMNADLPPEKLILHRQWLVMGHLIQMQELVRKVLALDQQFMDPLQVSRVIGSAEMPFTVTREEIAGQYDVQLAFDVRSLDMAWMKEKLNVLKEAVQFDRSGAFKDVPVMRYLISSIDPSLADLAIADVESARDMEAEDEKKAIGTLLSGIEIKPPNGSNAAVRLQTAEAEIAQNPVVNQRYQQDQWFRRMMDRRMAKWQFDLQQRENAQTGRSGWKPAMEDVEE